MHLLYTTDPTADVSRYSVRNPHYFLGVEIGADAVTVQGDFPAITAAYEAAGVPVSEAAPQDGIVPDADQRATLIAELQARGVEFDESWPTDELRALSITPSQPVPAKRGRKPSQQQE